MVNRKCIVLGCLLGFVLFTAGLARGVTLTEIDKFFKERGNYTDAQWKTSVMPKMHGKKIKLTGEVRKVEYKTDTASGRQICLFTMKGKLDGIKFKAKGSSNDKKIMSLQKGRQVRISGKVKKVEPNNPLNLAASARRSLAIFKGYNFELVKVTILGSGKAD